MKAVEMEKAKMRFEVLLSATMQKTFVVEAHDEDEARALMEKRWTEDVGGRIQHNDLECTDVQFDVIGEAGDAVDKSANGNAPVRDVAKVYTVDGLIEALKSAAQTAPRGGATKVRIGDWEGNMAANGLVETLEVAYDPYTSRMVIYCDPYEC